MAVRAFDLLTLAVLPSPSYVRQFYLKQASTLAPPTAPSTNPPAAPWSTTEPTYTPGSTDTLYTVMLTAYGSVAFEYGPVQKSSSFEAAKQAYNRSDAAVDAAVQAQKDVDVAQKAADAAMARAETLLAKGDNLVINGSAEMGDTRGWPSAVTVDMTETPGGFPGAFKVLGAKSFFQTEKIPVNPSVSYRMTAWIKSVANQRHYLAILQYDIDGLNIAPYHSWRYGLTDTKLTSTLNTGDTQFTVTDASKWVSHMGVTNRYLMAWPYVANTGQVFNIKDGYTRHTMRADTNGGITVSGNTVTLANPWTGPNMKVGDDVAIGLSGGNYIYPQSRLSDTDDWEKYEGTTVAGVSDGRYDSGFFSANRLSPATAFVSVGFLMNYQNYTVPAVEAWFTGVRLVNDAENQLAQKALVDAKAAQDAADAAQAKANTAHTNAGNAWNHADAAMNKAGAAEGAAADAVTHADNLPKVLHGTTVATGTAPNGSIWWQHQSTLSGSVIGQWNRVNNAWVSTPIDSQAIANLDVGKLTAGSAEVAELVTQKLLANEAIINRLTVGVQAWIDGVLIKENTVRGKQIIADESMTTKIFGAETGVIEYLTTTAKATFLAGLDAIGESWIDGVNIKDKAITAELMNFIKTNGVNNLILNDQGLMLRRIANNRPIFVLDESGLKAYDPRDTSTTPTFSVDPVTGRMTAVDGSFSGHVEASSGTFKGHIEASSGSFKGDVTGATFTSQVNYSGAWGWFFFTVDTMGFTIWSSTTGAADSFLPVSQFNVDGINIHGKSVVTGPDDWVTIPKRNGWVNVSGRQPARYRRDNDKLVFSGAMRAGTDAYFGDITNELDRPITYNVDSGGITKPGSQDVARLTVNTNGRLEVNTLASASGQYISLEGGVVYL